LQQASPVRANPIKSNRARFDFGRIPL